MHTLGRKFYMLVDAVMVADFRMGLLSQMTVTNLELRVRRRGIS